MARSKETSDKSQRGGTNSTHPKFKKDEPPDHLRNSASTSTSNTSSNSNGSSNNQKKTHTGQEELHDSIKEALLMRAYHLPGYSYGSDLYQYLTNNHPVFGIWFHHPLHPIGAWMRVATLVGSLLFGLAMTNIIYLAFVFTNHNYNVTYVAVPVHNNITVHNAQIDASLNQQIAALTPSAGNIALWTIGAALNAVYDNIIWSIAAWDCGAAAAAEAAALEKDPTHHHRVRRHQSYLKNFLVMLSVVVAVAFATFAATLRQALASGEINQSNVTVSETVQLIPVQSVSNFEFLVAFAVELGLSLLVYYPIVAVVLFTGVLGCGGQVPLVGGRPREIRMEEERERQHEHQPQPYPKKSKNQHGTVDDV